MHSENDTSIQDEKQRSFIEEARRSQIVGAAITTLAKVGYAKASLGQIAKHARVSTSLILYHFNNKEELIYQTLNDIIASWHGYVRERVASGGSPSEQLRIFVESNLAYMGTRAEHYAALVEILFNARTPEGVLLYLTDDEEDPALTVLKSVLAQGQETGEFRAFNVHHMALAIQGAIGEFFGGMHKPSADLEAYTADLVHLFTLATKASTAGPSFSERD